MFLLNILDMGGAVIWVEEFRSLRALQNRAPDAFCELDNQFACYVDDLIMVPVKHTGFSTTPAMRAYHG